MNRISPPRAQSLTKELEQCTQQNADLHQVCLTSTAVCLIEGIKSRLMLPLNLFST